MISVLRVKCLRDDVICPKSKQEEREELGAEEAQVLTMTPTPTDALILAHLECRSLSRYRKVEGIIQWSIICRQSPGTVFLQAQSPKIKGTERRFVSPLCQL